MGTPWYVKAFTEGVAVQKTRDTYIGNVQRIEDAFRVPITRIMSTPGAYVPQFESRFASSLFTLKNYTSAVLAAFKYGEPTLALKCAHPREYDAWLSFNKAVARRLEVLYLQSKPLSERQEANQVQFSEIEDKYDNLRATSPRVHDTLKHSVQFLLLSVVALMYPKRADLGQVRIFRHGSVPYSDPIALHSNFIELGRSRPPIDVATAPVVPVPLPWEREASKGPDDTYNALPPGWKGGRLVVNVYKTAKVHKQLLEPLPPLVEAAIWDSLERFPRDFLFVDRSGGAFSSNTAYSVFVIRTMTGLFGRGAGLTDIRHAYINHKIHHDSQSLGYVQGVAKLMGQSVLLQLKYGWHKT
jgi:hypothetical protein